jgi:hypothetical protein
VVTTSYVTSSAEPIVYVTREIDEDEEFWQFHCGNGDYSQDRLQLVSLATILSLDPSVSDVADLPDGFGARREGPGQSWVYAREGQ